MLAVRDAVSGADLHRGDAEALLPSLFCDLWNQAERMVDELPVRSVFIRKNRATPAVVGGGERL